MPVLLPLVVAPIHGRVRRALLALGALAVAATLSVGAFAADAWVRVAIDGDWRGDVRAARPPPRPSAGLPTPERPATPTLVATLPEAEVWDLASSPDGLVVATARSALAANGGRVVRVAADGTVLERLAWAGQGFLRVHVYGRRVVVPDGDAPFSLVEFAFRRRIDGFVFVSDPVGALGRRARTVLPDAYHVFDVARLEDGTLIASTGAYPEGETAYLADRAPAVLYAATTDDAWSRWLTWDPAPGVNRFTWLSPLPDGGLLAATTTARGFPSAVRIDGPDVHPVPTLDGYVLRWAQVGDSVFALTRVGQTTLWRSNDAGRSFVEVAEGLDGIVGTDDALFAVADGRLLRGVDGTDLVAVGAAAPIPPAEGWRDVAMVVHDGHVWAAGDGRLYRW